MFKQITITVYLPINYNTCNLSFLKVSYHYIKKLISSQTYHTNLEGKVYKSILIDIIKRFFFLQNH